MAIRMVLINATCRPQNRPWVVILDAWCLIENEARNLQFQIKHMFWALSFMKNYNSEDILAMTLKTRNAKKLREEKVLRGILQLLATKQQHDGVKVSAKIDSFSRTEMGWW